MDIYIKQKMAADASSAREPTLLEYIDTLVFCTSILFYQFHHHVNTAAFVRLRPAFTVARMQEIHILDSNECIPDLLVACPGNNQQRLFTLPRLHRSVLRLITDSLHPRALAVTCNDEDV